MSVSRKILEGKSNQELEKYIAPDSKFVPEANLLAYEILKVGAENLPQKKKSGSFH